MVNFDLLIPYLREDANECMIFGEESEHGVVYRKIHLDTKPKFRVKVRRAGFVSYVDFEKASGMIWLEVKLPGLLGGMFADN